MKKIEFELWKQGHSTLLGIDEVGRGSLAGPLVVGGVFIRKGDTLVEGVNDSKQLLPKVRQTLNYSIRKIHKDIKIVEGSNVEIDVMGMRAVLHQSILGLISLFDKVDVVLLDGRFNQNFLDSLPYSSRSFIHGDQRSYVIGAASIVAKVYRDEFMVRQAVNYPEYCFEKHKGYGTVLHRRMIDNQGMCPLHRKTFCHKTIAKL